MLEIIDDFDGDTYRAVYTVKFKGVVYALHAFQKKSKKGISTPKEEIDLVKKRLKASEEHYQANYERGQRSYRLGLVRLSVLTAILSKLG